MRSYPGVAHGGFLEPHAPPAVLALERFDDDTGEAAKAPLLLDRVNRVARCASRADTPADAIARADGAHLRVGGLVIARQAPGSAKGFRFFTLADEGGHLDIVLIAREFGVTRDSVVRRLDPRI